MADRGIEARSELCSHAATRAWWKIQPGADVPWRIESLKERRNSTHRYKSYIFRLHGAGVGQSSVVAKLCRRDTAQVEQLLYEEILPQLPIPRLEFFGATPDEESKLVWIFLQDAGEGRCSHRDDGQRHLFAEWASKVHTLARDLPELAQLPDRGLTHHRIQLRSAIRAVERVRSETSGRPASSVLARTLRWLSRVERLWDRIEEACAGLPRTLVHGDLVGKNARLPEGGEAPLVFDWETAGRGFPGVDLASVGIDRVACCLEVYLNGVRRAWSVDFDSIERMANVGCVLRMVVATEWITPVLESRTTGRPITYLKRYGERIDLALRALGWGT